MRKLGILCPRCREVVVSRSRHDCRSCFCEYCYVDGGDAYMRVGWGGPAWSEPHEIPITVYADTGRKIPRRRSV